MNILTSVTVVIHLIASVTLIILVLLHSGKGGGLSDMLGGGQAHQFGSSTVAERNLNRITGVVIVIFTITTVILGMTLEP
ncbi:MAG: preprotein translocase subunit SecG [Actinobacteria bacterium]|nr:preprotein translocase subunit SecG [Actinomycetota bacterium]MCB9388868.1 preprotein translocase subunit SecG [Acidimicrobiia bacterium]